MGQTAHPSDGHRLMVRRFDFGPSYTVPAAMIISRAGLRDGAVRLWSFTASRAVLHMTSAGDTPFISLHCLRERHDTAERAVKYHPLANLIGPGLYGQVLA